MRRLFIALFIVITLIAAGFFVARRYQARGVSEVEIIRQAKVTRGTIAATVSATGSIEPEALVSLSFGVGGTVKQVNVFRGQQVSAGQLLTTLDTGELTLAVQQAEDALRIQQLSLEQAMNSAPSPATLDSAQADIDAARGNIAIANANLNGAEASLAQVQAQKAQLLAGPTAGQIAAAESQVVTARLQEELAQKNYNRTLECFTIDRPGGGEEEVCPGLGPAEEQARDNLESARAARSAAEANLADLLAGPRPADLQAADAAIAAAQAQVDSAAGNVLVAEANLKRAEAAMARLLEGINDQELAIFQAQVDSAMTNLAMAKLRQDKAQIVAPMAGQVASILIREGEQVAPGGTVINIIDETAFHIEVSVDEIDIDHINEGQEVQIIMDELPDEEVDGFIADIAPTAATSGVGVVTYDVTINIVDKDVDLRAGMTANASIIVEEIDDVLIVPNWAIRLDRESGQAFVNRMSEEGAIEEVVVEIGLRNEQVSRVLSGLTEGDTVLITNEREGLGIFGT